MAATRRLARMVEMLQRDPGVSIDELAAHLGVPDAVVVTDLLRSRPNASFESRLGVQLTDGFWTMAKS